MTAYGRATMSSTLGVFVVEIQSLNRKYLEINVQLPTELTFLETDIRKWVASKVRRGKVVVKLTACYEGHIPLSVIPNIPLVRQLKSAWEKIAEECNIEGGKGFRLEMLANEPGIMIYNEEFDEEEKYKETIHQAVTKSLERLIEMKVAEGKAIQEDFIGRIQQLTKGLKQIHELSQGAPQRFREKLKKNIEEILPGSIDNEERILREICVYAEKVDIAEEMTRFDSHLKQFMKILEASREDKGKTLEFILQELLRETNTIGSKSADVEISKYVVEIKSEIEKIREQVQNVE